MSIKSQGGVFGRNPTFNDVTVEGDLSIAGTLSVGGETITCLSYQGGWNASTNTPDIAASSPVTGQFWIASADGSTNVGGITNWTSGDWALYDGSAWQRVEGGNTDLSTGVQGQLAVANGGTGAADAATARTNLGLGTAATTASTDYATAAQGALADTAAQTSDIGVTIQGYDADTAKYDDATANFTGTLQKSGNAVLTTADDYLSSADIGTIASQDADSVNIDGGTIDGTQIGETTLSTGKFSYSSATRSTAGYAGEIYNTTNASTGHGLYVQTRYNVASNIVAKFTTNSGSADVMTLTGDRNVEIHAGNLKFGTSGNGIDFSATSGTGTSELLDDYEEGTWTPASGTNCTVNNNWGCHYTKVGRQVTAYGYARITNTAASFTIGGLPYNNNAGYGFCMIFSATSGITSANGYVNASASTFNVNLSNTGSSRDLRFVAVYFN